MGGFHNLLVIHTIPQDQLDRVKKEFENVYYYPFPRDIPEEVLEAIDVIFVGRLGFSPCIKSLAELPKLWFVQAASTGLERIIPAVASISHKDVTHVHLANAAGGYVQTIPNFVISYITALLGLIPSQIYLQRTQKRWVHGDEVMADAGLKGSYVGKSIIGKTIGFLGYGTLGRESARLCSIFPKVRLIAANSDGKRKAEDGYVIDGTGDFDASLPAQMYSTNDPTSFEAFLKECDILVASLPHTKQTVGLLDSGKLSLMKPGGLFINVGRGSLIKSEHILESLDAPNGLYGAAIDVTDPEPLEDNHPLWSHPRLIITPHLSGEPENEMQTSIDILLTNTQRLVAGKDVLNKCSFETGY
ncbi:D-isomer specific 2-hydroxyacid dehydrogenase [Naematelia encephala]|uniref:D-isomer specific 2-hydroxyacid dehydrogenase n=1 Tax=Naematelia encephala TaxID=71784 RepID=A0A1Y2AGD8_9TREE|nr:D-isomer specific 2-hydroxyacid dehydrogenase [Naematelia encephala]